MQLRHVLVTFGLFASGAMAVSAYAIARPRYVHALPAPKTLQINAVDRGVITTQTMSCQYTLGVRRCAITIASQTGACLVWVGSMPEAEAIFSHLNDPDSGQKIVGC